MAAMAGGAKPFVWFGRACDSLTEADVATIRGRLVRELAHVLSYMAVSDLGEQEAGGVGKEEGLEVVKVSKRRLEEGRYGRCRISCVAGVTASASAIMSATQWGRRHQPRQLRIARLPGGRGRTTTVCTMG